jgi:pilus assembly protein CpaB
MKRNRLLIIFALALTSGGLAGFLALRQLGGSPVPTLLLESRGTIQLAVAAHDLGIGTVLRDEDIRLIEWPEQVLPQGYAGSKAELAGRGLMVDVKAHEPILEAKLADRESGGGLPILIPEGMRAVSVRVDDVIAVAGYVLPGTRVDVLVTVGEGTSNANPITRVVLQNVRVMAAGQTLERDEDGRPQTVSVVTLLVSPEDGEKLVLAATQGRVQLALRNMLDDVETATRGVAVANLINASAPPPGAARAGTAGPAAQPRTVVETIRGGQRTLNNFSGNP